jgi:hypothetical protein
MSVIDNYVLCLAPTWKKKLLEIASSRLFCRRIDFSCHQPVVLWLAWWISNTEVDGSKLIPWKKKKIVHFKNVFLSLNLVHLCCFCVFILICVFCCNSSAGSTIFESPVIPTSRCLPSSYSITTLISQVKYFPNSINLKSVACFS